MSKPHPKMQASCCRSSFLTRPTARGVTCTCTASANRSGARRAPLPRRHLLASAPALLAALELRPAIAGTSSAVGKGELPLGEPAPRFELPAVNIRKGRLAVGGPSDKWTVVYFYPADFTIGCSVEARTFQRDLSTFRTMNANVVGVSVDTLDSHQEFCTKNKLEFPLLADSDGKVSFAYNSLYAPEGFGVGFSSRHTFLLDPQGLLRAQWFDVNPVVHSTQVLNTLRELQSLS